MALDVATFITMFPEFAEVADASEEMVELYILDATPMCSRAFFGPMYERAVLTKAAHLLAMTPLGQSARLEPEASTTYAELFKELQRGRPRRMLVSGVTTYGDE